MWKDFVAECGGDKEEESNCTVSEIDIYGILNSHFGEHGEIVLKRTLPKRQPKAADVSKIDAVLYFAGGSTSCCRSR